ncbi:HAD family hydrolase [Flammeovirga sp. MY04]|uniref:HAD family hydrolase n=1 Tax=Flammeovirga sp. MY04 TaxID=1191459 RepID=UPI0008060F3C|nr:HAD family hydrolase [Flammeovirga sp. MY04]ANQ47514.1 HAD family hydrolase [Flammeovirga sp. MY04]
MKFDYIFSDCDGVIIDSEIIAAKVMVKYIKEFGVEIDLETYLRTCSGKTFSGIMTELSQKHQIPLKENFVQEITDLYMASASKYEKAIDGVKEAFNAIQLPKAIISNGYKAQINHSVDFCQLRDQFEDRVFSGVEDVEHPKPAPDIYLHAAKQIGVDPSRVIVIEDSKSGAKAAVDAGMYVIGFTGASHILEGHDQVLYSVGVKHVINNMSELPLLIDEILN